MDKCEPTSVTGEVERAVRDSFSGTRMYGKPISDMDALELVNLIKFLAHDYTRLREKVRSPSDEARSNLVIEELETIQALCESGDGEFAFNLANAIEDRIFILSKEA